MVEREDYQCLREALNLLHQHLAKHQIMLHGSGWIMTRPRRRCCKSCFPCEYFPNGNQLLPSCCATSIESKRGSALFASMLLGCVAMRRTSPRTWTALHMPCPWWSTRLPCRRHIESENYLCVDFRLICYGKISSCDGGDGGGGAHRPLAGHRWDRHGGHGDGAVALLARNGGREGEVFFFCVGSGLGPSDSVMVLNFLLNGQRVNSPDRSRTHDFFSPASVCFLLFCSLIPLGLPAWTAFGMLQEIEVGVRRQQEQRTERRERVVMTGGRPEDIPLVVLEGGGPGRLEQGSVWWIFRTPARQLAIFSRLLATLKSWNVARAQSAIPQQRPFIKPKPTSRI